MSTRVGIVPDAALTNMRGITPPPKATSPLTEPLRTHTDLNHKNSKEGISPLGRTSFALEALSDFLAEKTGHKPPVRLFARQYFFDAIDDWLNNRRL